MHGSSFTVQAVAILLLDLLKITESGFNCSSLPALYTASDSIATNSTCICDCFQPPLTVVLALSHTLVHL